MPDRIYAVVFACFAGPTCSPWSRLRNSPGGFKEDEADVSRACYAHLASLGPGCHKFLENVAIHDDLLPNDGDEQERLCGGVLWALNALDADNEDISLLQQIGMLLTEICECICAKTLLLM